MGINAPVRSTCGEIVHEKSENSGSLQCQNMVVSRRTKTSYYGRQVRICLCSRLDLGLTFAKHNLAFSLKYMSTHFEPFLLILIACVNKWLEDAEQASLLHLTILGS